MPVEFADSPRQRSRQPAADLGVVETQLPAAILERGESIGGSVGGVTDVPEDGVLVTAGQGLHELSVYAAEDGLVSVRVRLFAQLGGPEYFIVAGRQFEPSPTGVPSVKIDTAQRGR